MNNADLLKAVESKSSSEKIVLLVDGDYYEATGDSAFRLHGICGFTLTWRNGVPYCRFMVQFIERQKIKNHGYSIEIYKLVLVREEENKIYYPNFKDSRYFDFLNDVFRNRRFENISKISTTKFF